ncbi:tetratricopeptide repeat protein [Amycolatopsis rhizosphaerae]|uniref:Tetratricopeptide repeat protein n=1 Tax=Amycolatopsis rhizosphaerae TaxID=2053003 RepID=A0A558CXL3_9PSEU|nr:tetratricopeptide repeat protein [Amycolatopsis rhizosphaerae]TVT53443.1 tetratricopeptide repeat protein [Amycolatopsis rhizosphaerae]
MAATQLQAVRRELGYKASEVIAMLLQRAHSLDIPAMTATSLKTKLSVWENGHEQVSEPYQRLFRDIYGRTNDELGFPTEEADDATELRSRLTMARGVDAATVEAFRRQVDSARHVDRRFGAVTLLDQLRTYIKQIESLFEYSTDLGHRAALAGVLTEVSTLAGWNALDRNAFPQAWAHYERAKAAARESGSARLLAHATAEQAFVLIDIGETGAAVEQLAHARAIAEGAASPLLRAWLAAAHGEGLATVGDRDNALRAFDAANSLLPENPQDPALPFVFLGGSNLDRWRGNALAKLGESDAIDQLTGVLSRVPGEFTRAMGGTLVDLAFAHAAAGDREAARHYARRARRVASQIKSDRLLRRLGTLILPGDASGVA